MSFLGPFGPDDQLPQAPPSIGSAPLVTPQLPQAPPRRPSLFDKEHRSDTLLALGTGLLTGQNFTDGIAAAGQNVMGLRKQLRAEQTKTRE
ncbi:hypothetical protein SR41_04630 [Sphingomonas melonis]|uniref:Uncharacterized protein n=1 Tax=Sphingomonas melonis TaxID=152682 RepID=A0A0D1KYA9_9SPHN|nr:hypothetical protein [Sphingomonas melonis]KIU29299.1 hypothetical protein SR41_04630 [Sphingomonas melonis]